MTRYRENIIQRHNHLNSRQKVRLQHEAVTRCREAAKKFRFNRVYLFGSVIDTRPLSVWSDIDLVVEGLQEENYYALLGYLNSGSQYTIDLKLYEDLKLDMKEIVHNKGVQIYEPK